MFVQEIQNKTIGNYQITESHWMLPKDYRMYICGNVVTYHPDLELDERILPTFNHYSGADGGYVAIYAYNAEKGVYWFGGNTYVIGQVRMQGKYVGRVFIPVGYRPGDIITQDPAILAICEEYFPDMKGEIWFDGRTGEWHGIFGHLGDAISPYSSEWE